MTEKKLHWKTLEKMKREQEVTEEKEKGEKKSGKTEWSVVVGDVIIHTYKLEDCEDAHERAISLAAKKGGVVI